MSCSKVCPSATTIKKSLTSFQMMKFSDVLMIKIDMYFEIVAWSLVGLGHKIVWKRHQDIMCMYMFSGCCLLVHAGHWDMSCLIVLEVWKSKRQTWLYTFFFCKHSFSLLTLTVWAATPWEQSPSNSSAAVELPRGGHFNQSVWSDPDICRKRYGRVPTANPSTYYLLFLFLWATLQLNSRKSVQII